MYQRSVDDGSDDFGLNFLVKRVLVNIITNDFIGRFCKLSSAL